MTENTSIAESRDSVADEIIQQALKLCRGMTNEHGRQLLAVMFETAEQSLEDLIEEQGKDAAAELKEAPSYLADKVDGVYARYSELFLGAYDNGDSIPTAASNSAPMGLSLVDDDAVEQQIIVDRMASLAAAETQSQFSKLNRRFCFLQNRRIKPADSPLSPQMQARCMIGAMTDLQVPAQVRTLLYKALEEEFANALGYLYSELNEMLIDLEILPDIKHHVWRSDSSLRSGHSRTGLTESQREALENIHRPEKDELGELLQGLHSGDTEIDPQRFKEEADLIAPTLRQFNHQDDSDQGSILDRVDAIAEQGTGQKPEATREVIQQAETFIDKHLQRFMRDPDSRQAWLAGKIRAPFVRLAIEDPAILQDDNHPLRTALGHLLSYREFLMVKDPLLQEDLLEEFEDLVMELGQVSYKDKDALVIYAASAASCAERLKQDLKRQLVRLGKEQESQVQLQSVRAEIDGLFLQALVGNRYPGAAVEFLTRRWRNILLHCHLRQESDPESWQSARSLTDKVITLIPTLEEGIPENRQAEFSALMKSVWNQLVKHVGYRGSPGELAIELGLIKREDAPESDSDLLVLTGRLDNEWREVTKDDQCLADLHSGYKEHTAKSAKALRLWQDKLKPGSWVQISADEEVVTCRLLKVIGEGSRCVFVDGMGRKTYSMTALEVLEKIKKGKLKKVS